MVPRYNVLIVDPLEETHEVLRAALEPRGVRILATCQPAQGLAMARRHALDLIVLDVEHLGNAAASAPGDFAVQTRGHVTPLLLIGGKRQGAIGPADDQIVRKPYHYGPLIRKIEALLGTFPQPVARAA